MAVTTTTTNQSSTSSATPATSSSSFSLAAAPASDPLPPTPTLVAQPTQQQQQRQGQPPPPRPAPGGALPRPEEIMLAQQQQQQQLQRPSSQSSSSQWQPQPHHHPPPHSFRPDDPSPWTAAPVRQTWTERLHDKLVALVWMTVAVLVGYWAHVPTVLFRHGHGGSSTNHPQDPTTTTTTTMPVVVLLHVVAVLWGINLVLLLYLCVYIPRVVQRPLPVGKSWSDVWPIYCPRVIPTMTVLGVASLLLLVRATWPVWGFLAPAVVSVELLGGLFALQFVPWGWSS
ncbi:hypothetical protein ACA910_007549 [Epithemia clementina (nom. ined.)]